MKSYLVFWLMVTTHRDTARSNISSSTSECSRSVVQPWSILFRTFGGYWCGVPFSSQPIPTRSGASDNITYALDLITYYKGENETIVATPCFQIELRGK